LIVFLVLCGVKHTAAFCSISGYKMPVIYQKI